MTQYALVCSPAGSIVRALRMQDLGQVDVSKLEAQHAAYVSALSLFGSVIIAMQKQEAYPDSTFVEDPAVNIGNRILVYARLANHARQGEEALMESMPIAHIKQPGFVEGGDVLVTDGTLYIGLSKRTNANGADQLARIAYDRLRWKSKMIPIPASYLHLKGEVTYHPSGNFVTVSEEIAEHFEGSGHHIIVTPAEERFAANCISHDTAILIHKGSTKTANILKRKGLNPIPLDLSEFAKIDGAMTCLSKFFSL